MISFSVMIEDQATLQYNNSFASSQMNKAKKITKRHLQIITIFEYNIQQLLPSLKPQLNANTHQPLQFKTAFRNITYNYISDVTRGFEKIDYRKVYEILTKLYLTDLDQKVQENKGIKLQSLHLKYTPFSALIQDQIEILISKNYNSKESNNQYGKKYSAFFDKSSRNNPFYLSDNPKSKKSFLGQEQLKNLTFYIIHSNINKEEGSLPWLTFVQKYEFKNIIYQEDRPNQPGIVYSALFSYHNQGSAFSLNISSRFLQKYFQESCLFVSNKSIFLKHLVEQIKKTLRQKIESLSRQISNASFDNRHRRFLKLKNESFPIFQQLKSRSISYIREISPNRKQNPYFMQNTICRMMQNNNYKLLYSWQALKYYFDQQKRLRDKYNWQSFRQYHNMNIFNYIGKDNTGRPVLLIRVRNCLISKIKDKRLFFDYHFYLFEVYLQDQMEGWVDEFDVIVDGQNQVNDNTDIVFIKQILSEIIKLTLGRTHHLIGVNIGIIGKLVNSIFFPLLPQKILKNVEMFTSTQSQKVIDKLSEIMPNEAIPDFLEGQNHRTYFQEQNKPEQETSTYELSIENSLITDFNKR